MKGPRRRRRGVKVLVVSFILFAIFLGALLLRKYESRRVQPVIPPHAQKSGVVNVTLFFASADGSGLEREGREITACGEPIPCMESVLEELINGPLGDLAPTLPPTGMFHSIKLEGDLLKVDLANELIEALPAGSSSELLAVYSIIDSMALNFPQVKKVAILVAGAQVPTLKGHIDLRQPLAPDYSLEHGTDRGKEGEKR